jgi:hypothetical protein
MSGISFGSAIRARSVRDALRDVKVTRPEPRLNLQLGNSGKGELKSQKSKVKTTTEKAKARAPKFGDLAFALWFCALHFAF